MEGLIYLDVKEPNNVMNRHALSPEKTKGIILAGDAVLTFQSKKTGDWFTYHIKLGNKPGMPWFVSVLCGSDNQYRYIGCIFKDQDRVFHPSKKISPDSPSIKAFGFVFENLLMREDPAWISDKVDIFHQGNCCKCGRPLTTPHSIEMGIGPTCAGYAFGA